MWTQCATDVVAQKFVLGLLSSGSSSLQLLLGGRKHQDWRLDSQAVILATEKKGAVLDQTGLAFYH